MKNILLLFFFLCICLEGDAQDKIPFNGLLLDIVGKPIKRAHVYIKGPKEYALTDRQGRFGLTDVMHNDTLKILLKKKLYYVPVNGKKSMRIYLADEKNIQTKEDQELIDWGFGYISRREHTGVSNIISGEDLRKSGYNDIISALQGRISGLNVIGSGGNLDVSMRGTRSFTASGTPLFLIDNVIVNSFEGINLNDVDYVEIMKDASAYGSSGANGAIIVHTKTAR